MNALLDEHKNVVIEYAAETRIPIVPHESLLVHHESYDMQNLENVIGSIGGTVHGHVARLRGEENHV